MSKTTERKNMSLPEDRKWNDPSSILCRWKNDPNPVGACASEDDPIGTTIEIKKITDVESYMQEKFGGA